MAQKGTAGGKKLNFAILSAIERAAARSVLDARTPPLPGLGNPKLPPDRRGAFRHLLSYLL
jgi:hypothetical protein